MCTRHCNLSRPAPVLCAVLCLLLCSCSEEFLPGGGDGTVDPGADASTLDGVPVWPDMSIGTCKPGQDTDGDTIPDDVEGCNKDTDGDGLRDWEDTDADGDGILDKDEAGPNPKQPLDSDGDKTPDFQDTDSDNDGVPDGDEDLNKDGLLGCCLTTCGEKRKGCPVVKPGECGKGQKCDKGKCVPPVHFLCSNGESDPHKKVTFPGGTSDKDLPTFICHKAGETGGKGLKPIQFRKNKTGGWHVALENHSTYVDLVINGASAKRAAAAFDLPGAGAAVAGFIVSIPTTQNNAQTLAGQLVTKISTQLPGKANVSQLVSGSPTTSHDGFPTVVSTQLAITMAAAKNPPAIRDALVPLLLSVSSAKVTKLPAANFGPSKKDHVLAFQTLIRPKEGRALVMGAVAEKAMVNDTTKNTGINQEDLSNGTGLATLKDGDTIECDPFILQNTPVADIIWIVDESGSMNDNRQDIVNNAKDFFNRALKSGLDFRMGVAGVKNPSYGSVKVGKFCSKISSSSSDEGGADRFLKPTEQKTFESCIKNPPYYEGGSEYGLAHTYMAVKNHLPRKPGSANDLTRIRTEAKLVIIIATDEAPQELKSYGTWWGKSGFLSYSDYNINNCTSSKQKQIDNYVKQWITLLTGKSPGHGKQAQAIVHLIAGVCKSSCGYGPEYPWGYQEIVKATGGQMADICQKNLGSTLQKIIDSISGAASPAVLQYVPISASLAVALNKNQLARSRTKGFDYISASNSLIFVNVKFGKGDQVVSSYRRWTEQAGPIE